MELEHCVCLFDEPYNNIVKKMRDGHACTVLGYITKYSYYRYYNSQFMGKAAAKDVLKTFKECFNGMDKDKLLQVSMDGPNVNASFLTSLNEEKMDRELSHLVLLGSCGLHTIHNSFKHEENATGLNTKKLRSSMFRIFHESPSRRGDYEILVEAQNSNYPLQFCGHRWV